MGLRPTDGDEERMGNGEGAAKFGPFFRGAVSAEVSRTRKSWDFANNAQALGITEPLRPFPSL